jgi:DNA-binding response OmpR family regulator
MATILIIEDEPELVKVLRAYLVQAGFTVLSAARGDSGLALWEHKRPDLVILDINLPGMDGLDVMRAIRKSKHGEAHTPVMMLTARVEEKDQLLGLELGADDYQTKPFSPRVVVARVRALLRRAEQAPSPSQVVRAADLEIDLDAHLVMRAGKLVELTPIEFNLLAVMAAQPGRTFSRRQLINASQATTYDGSERTIDAHIKNLRAKLEENPHKPRYLETVFSMGYRFSRDAG